MPRPRIVIPTTEQVPLSDGDHVVLKKELSYGESLEVANTPLLEGQGFRYDQKEYQLTRLALYIVDWSFVDGQGKPIPWDDGKDDERSAAEILARRKQLIASLDEDTGGEIGRAIAALEAKVAEGKAPKIEGTLPEGTEKEVAPPPKIAVARSRS